MINISFLEKDLIQIKEKSPLIHNITNYVVMNSTANALLAIGASPVMAHAVDEVAEMTGIASALVINIGTLDSAWVEAMLIAGKKARERQIPVVFDPVGAGATAFRTAISRKIIEECKPSVIRGNASEIIALHNDGNMRTKGVDSMENSISALVPAKILAKQTNAIVVVSGERDYITNGKDVEIVENGSALMGRVTGMGCTATALIAVFAAVNADLLQASTHAMAIMGIAGEVAASRSLGNGSFQVNFLDELFTMNSETIRKTVKQTVNESF
jgi:hydroxyethylthiazole kinase